MIFRRIS